MELLQQFEQFILAFVRDVLHDFHKIADFDSGVVSVVNQTLHGRVFLENSFNVHVEVGIYYFNSFQNSFFELASFLLFTVSAGPLECIFE